MTDRALLFKERARSLERLMAVCSLCPRTCGAERFAGERGLCGAGRLPRVFAAFPHFGEEPPISGRAGSGAVFFSGCGLRCVYCQNHPFSQEGEGREIGVEELKGLMLRFQARGCHNLNLVTATPHLSSVLRALALAVEEGFSLPVVYNTSGYERAEVLALIDDVVDIYLTDLRYADPALAERYSGVADYVGVSRAAARFMAERAGPLQVDGSGIARRGVIVRHLVLPSGVSGTRETLRFMASNLPRGTRVSLMAQYYPAYRASAFGELSRRLSREEWTRALGWLEEAGLEEGWVQELPASADVPELAGSLFSPTG